MAILKSNKKNIPIEELLALEFKFGEIDKQENQEWLNFDIVFHLGQETKVFSSQTKHEQTQTGVEGQVGKFAFNLKPCNGVEELCRMIENFLDNDAQDSVFFEPIDPSFELKIERTQISGEYKVYCWVDAGNTQHLEYSWDAQGIRFIASEEAVQSFVTSLTNEIAS